MEVFNEYRNILTRMEMEKQKNSTIQTDYENNKKDFEITDNSPVKLQPKFQFMFDCRLKLLLYEDQLFYSGYTKRVATSCIIAPGNGWVISTKCNPSLGFIFQEEDLKMSEEKFRVYVTLTNISMETKYLKKDMCVGYLLLR